MDFKKAIMIISLSKPTKIGIDITSENMTFYGYNSKIFRGLHSVLSLPNNDNLHSFYEEYYASEIKNLSPTSEISLIQDEGITKIFYNGKKISPLGNIAREKKHLTSLYNKPFTSFHKLDIKNTDFNSLFKDFTVKKREILEEQDFGLKIIKIKNEHFYVSTDKRVLQLIKIKQLYYSIVGNIKSDIGSYKFPRLIKNIISRDDATTLYVADSDKYAIYGTNYGLMLFCPDDIFKYGVWDVINAEITVVNKNIAQQDNLTIRLNDKKELMLFAMNNGENIYFHVNKDEIKVKTNTSYQKVIDIMTVVSNDYNDDIHFALKVNTLSKIFRNKAIKYLTLNFNTATVVFTDNYKLDQAYNLFLTKTLKKI